MQKGLKKYFVNMDDYLSSLGLYRKMVARDASSLFRAVSEQLYYTQNYHQRIRQDCADFMRANKCNFEPFVEGSFEKYLERLEDPKETVGQVEIKALSQLYRRCFLIYRYPGKPATVISEDDFVDKVTLCCSINGHYDIVYPRSYPASAALCQSFLYELLYTKVFGLEEAEITTAMEAFRVGGRRYRNSPSVCSDVDIGEEQESGGAEDKLREDSKPPTEPPPPSRLSLPYKVMKSLDGDVYRNLEFDVWQDTCKEMQKTDYMVFAGRQYFLGDKCQVRLEPKGKYYNAFIQEVGTHSAAVTVFIEELGEKHLVPLTDLKPVNPVPAWNVAAPSRKGDLDLDSRGQRHQRHRYFRKSRGSSGLKGAELLMPPSYGGPPPHSLPPRFQPTGPRPPPPPPHTHTQGGMTFDPYAPPHHHHHQTARPPRYGAARSSTRFLNRHVIGPQLTYYHPGRRYYHDYESFPFRSRRSRRQPSLNKECQFGFSEGGEEPNELDPNMAYYHLDEGQEGGYQQPVAPPPSMVAPPPPSGSSYRVQRAPGPLQPAPGNPTHTQGNPSLTQEPVCSSEDDQDTSTVEDQAEYTEEFIYMTQDQSYQTNYPAAEPSANQVTAQPSANQDEQEEGNAESPPRQEMNFNYTQQVKPLAVICSSPSSSSSSPSSPSRGPTTANTQTRSVSMAIPAASPWLVNELGETLCTVVAPPPYSYDPNGTDLPRDCRVLQYYFNLGVQWYHQSCWQQQQQQASYPPSSPDTFPYQHYPSYLAQETPMHPPPPSFPEPRAHLPSYPECTRAADAQTDTHNSAASPPVDNPAPSSLAPPTILYQDQSQLSVPAMLHHQHYEPPQPSGQAAYLSAAPAHLSHHSAYHHACVSAAPAGHWGALQPHTQRVYCPAASSAHMVSYITGPPPHHTTAHYLPPPL